MKKKEYRMPSVKVVMIENSAILSGSTTIGKGEVGDPGTPTSGSGGFIPAESKRGYFDDAWDE